jgi:hypothetical protein
MPSFYDLLSDAKIVFLGHYFLLEEREYTLKGSYTWRRPLTSLLPSIIVCYEAGIWSGVLVVGNYYVLTSNGISNLVQACVALLFINEIDNMAFWIIDSENDDADYGKVIYDRFVDKDKQQVARTLFGIPVISSLVLIAIFVLHNTYC